MLARRISRYVKEQNWFAVWLEVVIVFLGVFIGLQANNWNEARIARETTNIYYARLIDDLRAEVDIRVARIAYFQRTTHHGEAALRALDQPNIELGEQFLIDLYQASQTWNYVVQRTTYDELLSGGIANAIPDVALRTRLANYYSGMENSQATQQETTPFRNNLRRHIPHAVQSTIRKSCGDRYEFLDNNVAKISLPEICDLNLDSQVVSEAIVALRSYVELEKDLTRHLGDVDLKIRTLESWLSPTREISIYLERLIQ